MEGIFLQVSTLSADRLSFGVRIAPSPQSLASGTVATLQIPNIGSQTVAWTPEANARTVGLGRAALAAAAVALPRHGDPNFPLGSK